ncbi:MAG: class IV adenylate cyclase [Acidobacteriota bacterium]
MSSQQSRHSYPLEIEIKLRVQDLNRTRLTIRRLGFQVRGRRAFEDNIILDTRDGNLAKARCLLRVRQFNRNWTLTLKSPVRGRSRYKVRQELETTLQDGTVLVAILRRLGLEQVFRYQKYRTIFKPGQKPFRGATLTLDETPIGPFLEIEGPSSAIDAVSSALGFSPSDYIRESYIELFHKLKSSDRQDMVFRP